MTETKNKVTQTPNRLYKARIFELVFGNKQKQSGGKENEYI